MIVCLGWGSLIWDRGALAVNLPWRHDGPEILVEYARVSKNGRLTLVLGQRFQAVRSLWVPMVVTDSKKAVENLRARERTIAKYIGTWERGHESSKNIPHLAEWANARRAMSVVWTNLPPKFQDENGRIPTVEEALEHLTNLQEESRRAAETYVRRTPPQIRTPYRQAFEARFGWKHLES